MSRLFLALIGLLAAAILALPATAGAARPSNDNFAAATVIWSLPFTDSADLTEATGEPGDPQTCATLLQTVWYSITPSTDEFIHADASGSANFNTEIDVYREDGSGPEGLTVVDCGSYGRSVAIPLEAGKTYYIAAGNAWGFGGTLQVNVRVVPTPGDFGAPVASPFSDPGSGTGFDLNGTFLLAGQPFFPIVLGKGPALDGTTPSGADALDEVVGAGVNMFKVGPATVPWTDADIADAQAWDAAALSRGVYTWVNLDTVSRVTPGSAREALLRKVVTTLKSDASARGIGMWKGADEPWWGHYAPSILQFAYCLVTGRGDSSWCGGQDPLDGTHLWVTIEAPRGTAADLAPYSAVTDTHGVDIYPVILRKPDPDLHQVGTWTRTIASITPNHNVWTTLQICFSGSYRLNPPPRVYILPTRLQERYMIYDAIINGARGLNFYGGNFVGCSTDADAALGWNWTFWKDTLADLIREINASSPLASVLVNPASTRRSTSSDPTTEVISRHGRGSNDLWVIAARHGAGTADVTISGLPPAITSGEVYTEGRSVTVKDGSFTDSFPRWGVHVYRFSPTAR